MNWLSWVIIAAGVAAYFVVKRSTVVRAEAAREWLHKGAKVIDVRSEREFEHEHLPGATNIPLDRLAAEIGQYVPGKDQPVLLHCLSGQRSSTARNLLRNLGYQNVFNLGSFGRARKILAG